MKISETISVRHENISFAPKYLIWLFLFIALFACAQVTPIPVPTPEIILPSPTIPQPSAAMTAVKDVPISGSGPAPTIETSKFRQAQQLSKDSLSSSIPANIFEEIAFFGQGGGVIGPCTTPVPDYTPPAQEVFQCNNNTQGIPKFSYPFISRSPGHLYTNTVFLTSGWLPNEKILITIGDPIGREQTFEQIADECGSLTYFGPVSLDDVAGQYTILFKGISGKLQDNYELVDDSRPGVTELDSHVLLYRFTPNELVTFFFYRHKDPCLPYWQSFIGQQSFRVGEDGKAEIVVDPDLSYDNLLVIGETSGEIEGFCNGITPLLSVGAIAQSIEPEIPFSFQKESQPQLQQVPLGSLFLVQEGPACADTSMVIWSVMLEDGTQGWVGERTEDTVYLQLAPASACPGAPPQRVSIGSNAYVCTKNDRLIVREEAGRKSPEVTRLTPGTQFTIIGGPVCASNWTWWQIAIDNQPVGWVAEGGDQQDPYYICPVK